MKDLFNTELVPSSCTNTNWNDVRSGCDKSIFVRIFCCILWLFLFDYQDGKLLLTSSPFGTPQSALWSVGEQTLDMR